MLAVKLLIVAACLWLVFYAFGFVPFCAVFGAFVIVAIVGLNKSNPKQNDDAEYQAWKSKRDASRNAEWERRIQE